MGFAPDLLAALRWVEYAMATACFTGFPLATSVLMFCRKAALLEDLTRGMITSLSWQSLPTHETLGP
jgi:hypothetical protein